MEGSFELFGQMIHVSSFLIGLGIGMFLFK